MDETKDLVPVIQIIDGRIQDNLTVVEQRVAEITEQYKNLVVTDVKDAKDTLAKLRKLSSTINAEKIRAKKIFLAPFEEIEQRIKKLAEMISIPVAEIDLQVKTAEQKIRDTRIAEINEMLEKASDEQGLDQIMKQWFASCSWRTDDRWTLEEYWTAKGNPTAKLTNEISSRIAMCKDGINTILSVAGEFTDQILDDFSSTGNLPSALSTLEQKKKAKAQAEELRTALEKPLVIRSDAVFEEPTPDEMPSFSEPSFMKGNEATEIKNDLPVADMGFPAFMQDPSGKKEFVIRVMCTEAEFSKVRTAFALARVEFEVL